MQNFLKGPKELIKSFFRNSNLILTLAMREILGRYRGSYLGLFWLFFNPFLMLMVYTFIFGLVFKIRTNLGVGSMFDFAMVLFLGLIVFNFFAECINRSTFVILSNVNYVKKVIFPLEILPIVVIITALFQLIFNFAVWFMVYIVFYGLPHPSSLFLPFVLLPIIFFTMGFSWIFAALSVYLRDLSQILGFIVSALMFLSPIFYSINTISESYQFLFWMNPLTPSIEITRQILFFGETPNFVLLFLYALIGLLVVFFGFFLFQKMRKGFADVI